MLRNVIENALRYAPVGGKVDVDLNAGPDRVVIDVRDNGPGIPPERRAAVFDRFLRGANEPSSGFGLGLSIVKRAAELHGARVDLREPEEGTGLHVHIILPSRP
jgi:two-component system sensor histidine kinase QseC